MEEEYVGVGFLVFVGFVGGWFWAYAKRENNIIKRIGSGTRFGGTGHKIEKSFNAELLYKFSRYGSLSVFIIMVDCSFLVLYK